MRRYAEMQLLSRIKKLKIKRKKFIRRIFKIKKTRKPFEYDVSSGPKEH